MASRLIMTCMEVTLTESEQTRKLCKALTDRGVKCFAIVASERQEPGWPDRFFSCPWFQVWIEFKAVRGSISIKQRIIIRRLRADRKNSAIVVRYTNPPRAEDEAGNVLGTFDGTAQDLCELIRMLQS